LSQRGSIQVNTAKRAARPTFVVSVLKNAKTTDAKASA